MNETMLNSTDFLTELTKTLVTCEIPQTLGEKTNNVFREKLGIKDLKLLVYDKSRDVFRDFGKDGVYAEKEDIPEEYFELLRNIDGQNYSKFIYNGKILNFENPESVSEASKLSRPANNKLLHPVFGSNGKCLIELNFDKLNVKLTSGILNILYSGFLQISSAVLNEITKENITKMCEFYSAMKDMAKIVENQYEQAYLLPQIGEIIDRFISSHLIYVFVKSSDGKFELFWPKACKEKSIFDLLQKSVNTGENIISEDGKTAIFPMKGENGINGAIAAYSTFGKLSSEETEYLNRLTKQSEITLKRAAKYSEMLKHATLDALTGLNNRHQMDLRLKQAVSAAERKNEDLCCMMADVDYFKKINDTYGHAAGDCVLKTLAEIITSSLREYDVACRYGGEEFLIILPGTSLNEAESAAQRLLNTVRNSKADISEVSDKAKELGITVSIGVSCYKKGTSADKLCADADKALYAAKTGGRNRVVAFDRVDGLSEGSDE